MGAYDSEYWYVIVVGHKVGMKYIGLRYILATSVDQAKEKAVLDQDGKHTGLDVLAVVYVGRDQPTTIR